MRFKDRITILRVYMRVCRDSGFRMDYIDAAHLAAKMIGIHAGDIAEQIGFGNMKRIAKGDHPALSNPLYAPL